MKILAANRLRDGEAVWLAPDHSWAETMQAAEIARDKAGEERLEALGREAFQNNQVLDVELVDVEIAGGLIRPIRLRERIKAAGPTIHPELGKQARPAIHRAA